MPGRSPAPTPVVAPRPHGSRLAHPADARTGEPRRPWTAWAGLVLFLLGAGVVVAGLLWAMWTSITDFAGAARLHRLIPLEQGDQRRLLLVVADWLVGVMVATGASIAGYHGWAGYRWVRWAGLIALALGAAGYLLNELATWALLPLAIGAIVLWLPAQRRFAASWRARRHPEPPVAPPREPVAYGPVRRFG